MKKIFYLMAVAIVAVAFTACSDSQESTPDVPDAPTEDEEKALADLCSYEMMLAQLCDKDTLHVVPNYTLRLGEVLDNARPDVYYVGVESEDEARSYFSVYFPKMEFADSVGIQVDATKVDYGKYGSVSYEPRDGKSEWAVVNIDLPELKDVITQLVFIPKAKWPTNDASPYNPGEVFFEEGKYRDEVRLWLCVQDWSCGHDGILISWDKNALKREIREDDYKFYEKVTNGVYNIAGSEAWKSLAHFYYSETNKFIKMYDKLYRYITDGALFYEKKIRFFDKYGFAWTLRYQVDHDQTYQVGEMWDEYYYWPLKKRYVWQGRTKYVKHLNKPIYIGKEILFQSGGYSFWDDRKANVPDMASAIELRFGASGVANLRKVYPDFDY